MGDCKMNELQQWYHTGKGDQFNEEAILPFSAAFIGIRQGEWVQTAYL